MQRHEEEIRQREGEAASSQPDVEKTQQLPQTIDADTLLKDTERRRKLEQELSRLGMTADEVRRLLNADSNSTDPLKNQMKNQTTAMPSLPTSPPTSTAGRGKPIRASSDSLNSFAAKLMSSRAEAQNRAVREVTLNLPDFRVSSPQEVRQAEQLLRDAAALRRREKYKEAEAKCREAVALVPKDGAALELLGDILQGVAHIDEALAVYKRALEADPKRSSAERKYGELLMQQQQWAGVDPEEAPRKPFFALFLSLLPGLGQFHNGDINKGLFFFAADAVCYFMIAKSPLGATGHHIPHRLDIGWITCLVVTLLVYLSAGFDAFTVARKGGRRPGGSTGWDV